jgi:hypothetical protein
MDKSSDIDPPTPPSSATALSPNKPTTGSRLTHATLPSQALLFTTASEVVNDPCADFACREVKDLEVLMAGEKHVTERHNAKATNVRNNVRAMQTKQIDKSGGCS